MQAARAASQLVYKRHNISIFEDFSAAIVRKRHAFGNVKKRLREQGIRFAMTYPATLRVQHNSGEKFFKQPTQAESFLDSLPEPSTSALSGTNRLGETE